MITADDMGLGKTLTMLALMLAANKRSRLSGEEAFSVTIYSDM